MMGQDFLSQEEVDALLRGVTGDPEDAPVDTDCDGLRTYDLGRQERIVRGRMPTLELIHERFARNLRVGLFGLTHRSTEISVGPIRVQKYSEFIRNLVVPTNLNIIKVAPFIGCGLLVFDPNLVFLAVDNVFGGDGRFHTRAEGREFTPTEHRVIKGLRNTIFREMERAWRPIHDIRFKFVRCEMNTQFANVATPSEIVVAVTFTLELAGNTADLHICLPYSLIEPIKHTLYSAMHSELITAGKRLTVGSVNTEVEVKAVVANLTVAELEQLQIGNVLSFDPTAAHLYVHGKKLHPVRWAANTMEIL